MSIVGEVMEWLDDLAVILVVVYLVYRYIRTADKAARDAVIFSVALVALGIYNRGKSAVTIDKKTSAIT